MKIDNILQLLIPKDKKFFPLFEKATANLVSVSIVLNEMVNSPSSEKRKELIAKIEDHEHIGDNITHDIFNELSSTFITPFDREDIQELTSKLDDIVDFIYGSAKRIGLYHLDEIPSSMCQLAELISNAAQQLHIAVTELKNLKNISKIKEACVIVNSIENQSDDIFNSAIAQLFNEETDAIKVIKIMEILAALETATDKCEDVANVINTIIIKTS